MIQVVWVLVHRTDVGRAQSDGRMAVTLHAHIVVCNRSRKYGVRTTYVVASIAALGDTLTRGCIHPTQARISSGYICTYMYLYVCMHCIRSTYYVYISMDVFCTCTEYYVLVHRYAWPFRRHSVQDEGESCAIFAMDSLTPSWPRTGQASSGRELYKYKYKHIHSTCTMYVHMYWVHVLRYLDIFRYFVHTYYMYICTYVHTSIHIVVHIHVYVWVSTMYLRRPVYPMETRSNGWYPNAEVFGSSSSRLRARVSQTRQVRDQGRWPEKWWRFRLPNRTRAIMRLPTMYVLCTCTYLGR